MSTLNLPSFSLKPVLVLAMTGLIFTRSQEGTQLDRLTQPGQTEQGIRYRVPSCWVLVGAAGRAVRQSRSGAHRAPGSESCSVRVTIYSVYSPYWYCSFTVCFICCSVQLPLSRSRSFCLFLSPLLPTPVWGEVVERPRGPLLPASANLQLFAQPGSWERQKGPAEQGLVCARLRWTPQGSCPRAIIAGLPLIPTIPSPGPRLPCAGET